MDYCYPMDFYWMNKPKGKKKLFWKSATLLFKTHLNDQGTGDTDGDADIDDDDDDYGKPAKTSATKPTFRI